MKLNLVAITIFLAAACASPSTPTGGGGVGGGGGGGVASHDGSLASPLVLTLGTPYSGKIGSWSDPTHSVSYYQFNTGGSSGTKDILVSVNQSSPARTVATSYNLQVFSDAAMTTMVGTTVSPNDNVANYFQGLTTAAVYYAKLTNLQTGNTTYQVTAQDPPAYKHDGMAPGSGSPMILFLNVSDTTSMVVTNLPGEDISYYAFTAPSTGTATISYPQGILDATVYSSNTFAGTPEFEETSSYTTTKSISGPVIASTSYYLKIKHWGSDPTRITGPLKVVITP